MFNTVSMCVCVMCLFAWMWTVDRSKEEDLNDVFSYFITRMDFSFLTIFSAMMNKTGSKPINAAYGFTSDRKWQEEQTMLSPHYVFFRFSCHWYRCALYYWSQVVNVIFLPFHVEKLLIVYWKCCRLLPQWYTVCRIFFCHVALSSLLCLFKYLLKSLCVKCLPFRIYRKYLTSCFFFQL